MNTSNKYIVGITGGIGCGKTTVTNLFADMDIDVVDADIVAREVVIKGSDGLNALVAHFGKHILLSSGDLNRPALRKIVFDDNEAKKNIDRILHPLIRTNMLQQLINTKSPYCILSAPLLFENNLHKVVTRSVVVDITQAQQMARTIERDGSEVDTIRNIIRSQISRKDRLRLADDIIDNTGHINALPQQVETLHRKYLVLSQN